MSASEGQSSKKTTTLDAFISRPDRRYSPRSSRIGALRCSRCAKHVEIIFKVCTDDISRRASMETAMATANGTIRYGHNLYYCDRCTSIVDYERRL